VKAIVLGAGLGTRLGPLTRTTPKILAPIAGRPLLDLQLDYLAANGVDAVGLNVHHHAEQIVAHARERTAGPPVRISHEPELLGTAGALVGFANMLTEPFVVLYGDVLTDLDLRALMDDHRASGAFATLAVHELPDVSEKGAVELADGDRISSFLEKTGGRRPGWVNAGIYVVDPAVLGRLPAPPADFGTDVWPAALDEGLRLQAYRVPGYVRDVGNPEQLASATRDVEAGALPW
jgi:mannose-1-phosphate guanylyltransferase